MKASDLRNSMEKKFPKSVYRGSELKSVPTPRISSGSFVFDMITGGGIPKNRISIFHGPKSSSKTTFALRVAGEFQRQHKDLQVLFVDFEGSFDDWEWADHYIEDRERLIVVKPDYGEVGIDIIKEYAEKVDDVGLIIIDSLAGIVPTKESEAQAADNTQIGLQVKLVNRMIRILIPCLSQAKKAERELTVIAINQIRANMDKGPGGYGSPISQPCGKFLEHACSMDVHFYTGQYTLSRKVATKVKHKLLVDKNKVSPPKGQGDIDYYLIDIDGHKAGDMDETGVVITYARRAGIIVREGAKWVIPSTKKDPMIFNLASDLMKALNEDRKLFNAVKKATLKILQANPLLTAAEEEDK